jgi:hypothetical protein
VTSQTINAAAERFWTLGDPTVNRSGFGSLSLSNADGPPIDVTGRPPRSAAGSNPA